MGRDPLDKSLHRVKFDHIYKVLKKCEFNRHMTARVLKISLRSVRNYIHVLIDEGYALERFEPKKSNNYEEWKRLNKR